MKRRPLILAFAALCVLSGCSGDSKKYEPKDRTTSTMSDSQRQKAIAAKKSQLTLDPVTMMTSNDVKLSVLPPYPAGDITEELSERIGVRMLSIIANNGIGGLNTVPGFALAAKISAGRKSATGTAPQKMVAEYTLGYQVINTVTGDVYATASQSISGVGDSYQQATLSAINSIKDDAAMQEMLASASAKIIEWFENNLPTFRNQVDAACTSGDYALALSLIQSVPQKATKAFEYANSRRSEISAKFQKSIAANELLAVKQAIQASGNTASADVYAHASLLPKDSKEYAEAQKLIAEYEKSVNTKAQTDAARAQQLELANIEAEKVKAKYQAKATELALRKHLREKDDRNRGFWGSLGSRIISAIDRLSGNVEIDEYDQK
jgi:hypothetical protein